MNEHLKNFSLKMINPAAKFTLKFGHGPIVSLFVL